MVGPPLICLCSPHEALKLPLDEESVKFLRSAELRIGTDRLFEPGEYERVVVQICRIQARVLAIRDGRMIIYRSCGLWRALALRAITTSPRDAVSARLSLR